MADNMLEEAIEQYGGVAASYAWSGWLDAAWHGVSRVTGIPVVVTWDPVLRIRPVEHSLWPSDVEVCLAQQFAKRGIMLTRYGVAWDPERGGVERTHITENEGFFLVDDADALSAGWEVRPWQMAREEYVARRVGPWLARLRDLFPADSTERKVRGVQQTLAIEHYDLVLRALRARERVPETAMDYPIPDYFLGSDYPAFVARRLAHLQKLHRGQVQALAASTELPPGSSHLVGTLDGQFAWTDGHLLLRAERPPEAWGGAATRDAEDFSRLIPDVAWVEGQPVGVIQLGDGAPEDYVVFATGDGKRVAPVHAGYYAYALSLYPDATFQVNRQSDWCPLVIRQGEKRVGAVMPFRLTALVKEKVQALGIPIE